MYHKSLMFFPFTDDICKVDVDNEANLERGAFVEPNLPQIENEDSLLSLDREEIIRRDFIIDQVIEEIEKLWNKPVFPFGFQVTEENFKFKVTLIKTLEEFQTENYRSIDDVRMHVDVLLAEYTRSVNLSHYLQIINKAFDNSNIQIKPGYL